MNRKFEIVVYSLILIAVIGFTVFKVNDKSISMINYNKYLDVNYDTYQTGETYQYKTVVNSPMPLVKMPKNFTKIILKNVSEHTINVNVWFKYNEYGKDKSYELNCKLSPHSEEVIKTGLWEKNLSLNYIEGEYE